MEIKRITIDQAIEIVSDYATPGDYGCDDWDQVRTEALRHVDGAAVALDIDDEYDVVDLQEIIKWNETIMRDSFGDLTDDEFDVVADKYIELVKAEIPNAEIDIERNLVGSPVGVNEVTWSDGTTDNVNMHNEIYFATAIRSIE